MEKYIRFDWAAKRILRDKANFVVLEGLMTVLLDEEVKIVELLESESNQEFKDDKFNRVDIKALNSKGEIIIVEIQQTRELYYLQRVLYGAAKAVTEHIQLGDGYESVKKVYSINIIYFDLGEGSDYLYHGQTSFVGVHTKDQLKVTTREESAIKMRTPNEIFPEYYIIRVNEFDKVAKTPLEEWIAYLKNGHINDNPTAPGLKEAKQQLNYVMMSDAERHAYEHHMENIMIQKDVLGTSKLEGYLEGKAEGVKEGEAKGKKEGRAETLLEVAHKMLASGMSAKQIASVTGLTEAEII